MAEEIEGAFNWVWPKLYQKAGAGLSQAQGRV